MLRSWSEQGWSEKAGHLYEDMVGVLPPFRQNFHRALYRFLIMAAALSRYYLEPYFDGKSENSYLYLGRRGTYSTYEQLMILINE